MTSSRSHPVFEDALVTRILHCVREHDGVLTPKALIGLIREAAGLDKRRAKSLIAFLVLRGDLEYTEVYGQTCVAPSFNRPVRVSPRVVLKPPECSFVKHPGDKVINLMAGTAFGRGAHPTTKLCIRALDWLFENQHPDISLALDIGTGTGVLALVAASLGSKNVQACDIDPMAIHEARENVLLNELGDRVHVKDNCDFSLSHDLVLANLRYPTLISLHPEFSRSLSKNGWIILSGIKNEELKKVRSCYEKNQEMIWTESEGGWSALVYRPT